MECAIQRVDQDNRVLIPQSALKHVIWIAGSEPLKAWLLVGSPGRCRLLSNAEFEEDAGCQSLKASIEAEETRPAASIMEFRDDALVAFRTQARSGRNCPTRPGMAADPAKGAYGNYADSPEGELCRGVAPAGSYRDLDLRHAEGLRRRTLGRAGLNRSAH